MSEASDRDSLNRDSRKQEDQNQDSRFVLYYGGPHPPPENHQRKIRAIPGLRILDETSPKLMLVDAPREELRRALSSELDGWTFEPEQTMGTDEEGSHG